MIGQILKDGTVKGGTGWGAEFAKLCNKPLFVFDEEENRWPRWTGDSWTPDPSPVITHPHIAGSGTRLLQPNGEKAVNELFDRSFK